MKNKIYFFLAFSLFLNLNSFSQEFESASNNDLPVKRSINFDLNNSVFYLNSKFSPNEPIVFYEFYSKDMIQEKLNIQSISYFNFSFNKLAKKNFKFPQKFNQVNNKPFIVYNMNSLFY